MRLRLLSLLLMTACATHVDEDPSDTTSEALVSWPPKPGTSWQWQLTGTIDTTVVASIYDIDLFDAPQSKIDALHAAGRKVVCYFSAGSYENWRPDASSFPSAVKGKALDGWPGEKWLDIRAASLKPIMQARLDLAKSKRCDGVEPDNVDGYANSSGFALKGSDQITYNKWLATEAHARGLAIALKNDLDQVPSLAPYFDWALNEQCHEYDECGDLQPFIRAGKAVWNVEYGSSSKKTTVCPKANAKNFDTLIKKLDLDAWRVACR